jgi:hypothetical protein
MGHGGQQPGGNNPGTGFQLLGITNKGAGVPPSPRAGGHTPTAHQHILANNLKKRVSSYFSKTHQDDKTRVLVANIDDFDVVITDTENINHHALFIKHLINTGLRC